MSGEPIERYPGFDSTKAGIELINVAKEVDEGTTIPLQSVIAMARKFNAGRRWNYKAILADASIKEGNQLVLLCFAG